MTTMIMTRDEAVKFLTAKGMKPASKSTLSNRVYFAFGSNDVFFDHSATMTKISKNEYQVADYSHLRNA